MDDSSEDSQPSKKSRHERHKKKIEDYDDLGYIDLGESEEMESPSRSSISNRLKIKIGHKKLKPRALEQSPISPKSSKMSKIKKRKGRSGDSDEERWLDAVESGNLEEVDEELRKMKNPKLMTARQRAMFEKKTDKPDGKDEETDKTDVIDKSKEMSEEMMKKRALKLERRKQLAKEMKEHHKKKTLDRLLKKQECKSKAGKNKSRKLDFPKIVYVNSRSGSHISMPIDHPFPLAPEISRLPPNPVKCIIPDCNKLKKYSCSRTKAPLCSMECYKLNLQSCC